MTTGKMIIFPTEEISTGTAAAAMARMRILAPTHISTIGSAAAPKILAMSCTTGISPMPAILNDTPNATDSNSGLREMSFRMAFAMPPSLGLRTRATIRLTTDTLVTGISSAVASAAEHTLGDGEGDEGVVAGRSLQNRAGDGARHAGNPGRHDGKRNGAQHGAQDDCGVGADQFECESDG
jgi:hypothetical protein